ncbi:MAG: protein phosphatase 2C domain-containing protein [Methylococcaceae bacterium]|nr:protein phosphatase 2C domain-containing protein [Methylococcaceae bacterium]
MANHFGHGSHIGLVRQCNEDSYACLPEFGLWVIADGMGGHAAGDVASGIAVREIARCIELNQSLPEAIESAHRSILSAAEHDRRLRDMGSTVVALKLTGNRYEIAWVGDSRAYLWNAGLYRLTKDHSYIQMMIDSGVISEIDASAHPHSNVISQALGAGDSLSNQIKVDTVSGELGANDTMLLCSDGLTGELSDQAIAAILSETNENQARTDQLIAAALKAGGKDNVTVIVLTAD